MIPIRDDAPRLTFPFFTWALIAANIAVFFRQLSMGTGFAISGALMSSFAMVPANVTSALTGDFPVVDGLLPILTSMFLHGGWMHLLGNIWFLRIFGDNVEDELGHFRFLLFYVACGMLAALAHLLAAPTSPIPVVGASGAIAGVMGAFLIRFPRARVTMLIPIIIFITTFRIPAFLMLTYWLAIQFIGGWGSAGQGGVAWWAHVGGFLSGVGLVLLRPRRREWNQSWAG